MTDIWNRLNKKDRTKYQYGFGEFEVWVTNGSYKLRLAYPTAKIVISKDSNQVVDANWTEDTLFNALQGTQRRFEAQYGGKWDLIIDRFVDPHYPIDKPIGAFKTAEANILAGPDTPGKRFLLDIKGKTITQSLAESMVIPKDVEKQKPDNEYVVTEDTF